MENGKQENELLELFQGEIRPAAKSTCSHEDKLLDLLQKSRNNDVTCPLMRETNQSPLGQGMKGACSARVRQKFKVCSF